MEHFLDHHLTSVTEKLYRNKSTCLDTEPVFFYAHALMVHKKIARQQRKALSNLNPKIPNGLEQYKEKKIYSQAFKYNITLKAV